MKAKKEDLMVMMARKKWIQKDLADAAQISLKTISGIFFGKSCSARTAGKIADAFGVDVLDVFEVEE